MDVSVVIPTFNEAATIAAVVREWDAILRGLVVTFEILVCDDASVDATPAILDALSRSVPSLRVVRSAVNRGHGPTVMQGYAEAAGTWVMQTDADNEIAAAEFARLWAARDDYDLLVGIRTPPWSSRARRFVSAGAGRAVALAFGPGVEDANCPFRLIRRNRLRSMLGEMRPNAIVPNVLMSGLAVRDGLRISQCPVQHHERVGRPRKAAATFVMLAKAIVEVGRTRGHRRTR